MLKACPCPLSRSYPDKNRINIGQNGLHQMPNMCKKQQQAFLQLHNLYSYILFDLDFRPERPKCLQNHVIRLDKEKHSFILIKLFLLLSFNKSVKILWIKSKYTDNSKEVCTVFPNYFTRALLTLC